MVKTDIKLLLAKVLFADVGSDSYNILAQSRLLGRVGSMYLEHYNDITFRRFCRRIAHTLPKWVRPSWRHTDIIKLR